VASNWGIAGENMHDPEDIEWLVIDRRVLGPPSVTTLDNTLGLTDWVVVLEEQDILVAHRPDADLE
jgi:hypothetical protein